MPTQIEFVNPKSGTGVISIVSDVIHEPKKAALYLSVTAVSNWGAKETKHNAFIKMDRSELQSLRSVIDGVLMEGEQS